MAHTCHATGCTAAVPPAMFMCRGHWFRLPRFMRDAIWATYRAGQENDKKPSHEYCLAAKRCITYLAVADGVVADTRLYDIFDPEK